MKKIFLHNLPKQIRPMDLHGINDPNDVFGSKRDQKCLIVESDFPNFGLANIRSDILSALILHDKICITPHNIINFLFLFGTDNCIDLLESDAIEIFKDSGPELGPAIVAILYGDDKYKLLNGSIKNYDVFEVLENNLNKLISTPAANLSKEKIDRILRSVICRTKAKEGCFKHKIVFKETEFDLKNTNITTPFNISSQNLNEIRKIDLPQIMRIHYINKGIINAEAIGCQCILIDEWAKSFICKKVSPALQKHSFGSSTDVFTKVILPKKGIPDLNILFANGIINICDILSLRNTVHGKRFRNWIKSVEYDPDYVVEYLLLKKPPSIKRKAVEFLRWIFPNIVGLVNPMAGLVASFSDSYIVKKLFEGWHPSLFLDDQFKFKIDKKIEQMEKNIRKANLQKFGIKTHGRAACPCGSGKKYKNCCGKP